MFIALVDFFLLLYNDIFYSLAANEIVLSYKTKMIPNSFLLETEVK